MAADEGRGATLSFGTGGWTLLCTSIQGQGISWQALDTTHLATATAKTFIRGDLYDPGTVNVNFLFEPEVIGDIVKASGANETITITYPNAKTEASSGFVQSIDSGNCEVDAVMMGSMVIKRSGTVTITT